jgi:hypothetical protein
VLHPAHGIFNLGVPSLFDDLDGGFSLGSGDFGSCRGQWLRDWIEEVLNHERLRADRLALCLAAALVGEDGEICQ